MFNKAHQTTDLVALSPWTYGYRIYVPNATRTSAKSERIVEMIFLLGCKGTKSSFYEDVGRDTYG